MIKIELELYTVDGEHDDESLVKHEIQHQLNYDILEYKVVYTDSTSSITST